jgi:hypothetical protein
MIEVKIKLVEMKKKASLRNDVNLDDILAMGRIEGETFYLEQSLYRELWNKFNPSQPVPIKKPCGCSEKRKVVPAKSYPPLMTQLGNALKASGRALQALGTGKGVKVADEVLKSRKTICEGCEDFDKQRGRCKACGCFTKFKLMLKTEQCPRNLWS